MRRLLPAAVALLAACVAPEPVLDARGAVPPGGRLVVAVYQAPGPWIVADPDSKAESAAKLLPIGMLMQTMQDDRVLELSKELQPYLPRPRYERAFEAAYLAELRALHDGKAESWTEAALPPEARREFNRADDQLDWRRRYLLPRGAAPRDYSRFLTLDDAVVVDVNLQYGTDVTPEEGRLMPTLTAATRVYRPGTSKLLWSRVDVASDQGSTRTLSEFRAEPKDLTDRLEALVPQLAKLAAGELAKGLRLNPPAPAADAAPAPSESVTALPYGLTPAAFEAPAASTGTTTPSGEPAVEASS
ncbi:MAG: hypothetical protein SF051_14005, partial [Elusimicrobiota bacterium]|nr:hypothetical protein [Elusimicrobiota bacterium]